MTFYKRYKELGISDKEKFTDEEFAQMPNISVLYPLWREYKVLEAQKISAERRLASAQARNATLPDNSARITELESYIAAINGATLLERIKLKDTKKAYEVEKEQLEAEEMAADITPIQSEITTLAGQIITKTAEINAECAILGIEAIING